MTLFWRCLEKSPAPAGKSVGKAQEKCPSVVNSLIGIPPIEGDIKVVD